MTIDTSRTPARVITARLGLWARLGELWGARELLVSMVRTELKVKYKNSILGFMWSMLNPALYLVVFYIVFQLILGSGLPDFAIYLLSGLLVWNLFSSGLGSAVGSVSGAGGLVKKVSFPRAILPLASVGASLVHFFLQAVVLVAALVLFRHPIGWDYVWLLPIALAVLVLLTSAIGLFVAAFNVRLRDTQHFLELALLAWFWMTPIVYPWALVGTRDSFYADLWQLNPVQPIVLAFQRCLYNVVSFTDAGGNTSQILPDGSPLWYLGRLALVGAGAAVLFLIGLAYFGRVEGDFAEEL